MAAGGLLYTGETPPLFAVLAHGMAAVAFWRGALLVSAAWLLLRRRVKRFAVARQLALPLQRNWRRLTPQSLAPATTVGDRMAVCERDVRLPLVEKRLNFH